uniref:RING-type domain-containing protein n=1 Tax=Chromera velia CCMP2878 TaxID=1169474 RepID=A0A0G4HWD8_9ALVE|eukprot:Cvel_9024.t1-p1 / transcript=Cvel_9024.t1 / gene=Cvel_9024 / organism=Chromera_velia_CCMP2878 / gene_product=E3 ubiquitin-protein ligase NEURL1B, putative / transcript_product=E3 ubiquitin-protein ligase NEURL1B, putative / location=Cvel_scaffold511:52723-63061(-) / protein_length=1169 / sequence_SO=supercontig / SO=protein_coding / is_pseudo=false
MSQVGPVGVPMEEAATGRGVGPLAAPSGGDGNWTNPNDTQASPGVAPVPMPPPLRAPPPPAQQQVVDVDVDMMPLFEGGGGDEEGDMEFEEDATYDFFLMDTEKRLEFWTVSALLWTGSLGLLYVKALIFLLLELDFGLLGSFRVVLVPFLVGYAFHFCVGGPSRHVVGRSIAEGFGTIARLVGRWVVGWAGEAVKFTEAILLISVACKLDGVQGYPWQGALWPLWGFFGLLCLSLVVVLPLFAISVLLDRRRICASLLGILFVSSLSMSLYLSVSTAGELLEGDWCGDGKKGPETECFKGLTLAFMSPVAWLLLVCFCNIAFSRRIIIALHQLFYTADVFAPPTAPSAMGGGRHEVVPRTRRQRQRQRDAARRRRMGGGRGLQAESQIGVAHQIDRNVTAYETTLRIAWQNLPQRMYRVTATFYSRNPPPQSLLTFFQSISVSNHKTPTPMHPSSPAASVLLPANASRERLLTPHGGFCPPSVSVVLPTGGDGEGEGDTAGEMPSQPPRAGERNNGFPGPPSSSAPISGMNQNSLTNANGGGGTETQSNERGGEGEQQGGEGNEGRFPFTSAEDAHAASTTSVLRDSAGQGQQQGEGGGPLHQGQQSQQPGLPQSNSNPPPPQAPLVGRWGVVVDFRDCPSVPSLPSPSNAVHRRQAAEGEGEAEGGEEGKRERDREGQSVGVQQGESVRVQIGRVGGGNREGGCGGQSGNGGLRSRLENVDRDLRCFICFEGQCDAIIADCGHAGLCLDCAKELVRQGRFACPICRSPLKAILRIIERTAVRVAHRQTSRRSIQERAAVPIGIFTPKSFRAFQPTGGGLSGTFGTPRPFPQQPSAAVSQRQQVVPGGRGRERERAAFDSSERSLALRVLPNEDAAGGVGRPSAAASLSAFQASASPSLLQLPPTRRSRIQPPALVGSGGNGGAGSSSSARNPLLATEDHREADRDRERTSGGLLTQEVDPQNIAVAADVEAQLVAEQQLLGAQTPDRPSNISLFFGGHGMSPLGLSGFSRVVRTGFSRSMTASRHQSRNPSQRSNFNFNQQQQHQGRDADPTQYHQDYSQRRRPEGRVSSGSSVRSNAANLRDARGEEGGGGGGAGSVVYSVGEGPLVQRNQQQQQRFINIGGGRGGHPHPSEQQQSHQHHVVLQVLVEPLTVDDFFDFPPGEGEQG